MSHLGHSSLAESPDNCNPKWHHLQQNFLTKPRHPQNFENRSIMVIVVSYYVQGSLWIAINNRQHIVGPSYGCTLIYRIQPLLMDILVVFSSARLLLLQIILQLIITYDVILLAWAYLWDEFLKVELLDTRGYAFIVLIAIAKLSSSKILLIYTSINDIWKSLLSHTLSNTVCYQTFWFLLTLIGRKIEFQSVAPFL